jgi:exodeoxyribonuclease VII large subunit
MSVLVRVQVTYSELYGLTLTIDDLDPQFTLGEQELEKRRTIARLEAEGLLERQQALVPSALPYALAVVTARDAAGYGDFSRHLHENEYGFVFRTDLYEATMQGPGAPESIVDALDRIESSGTSYDAVLILRGGGSTLDLACFDDYGLCWRIAQCPVPVYTAIGHDRDHHVADMVAYSYVKTPTALADLFLDSFMAEDERISGFGSRLRLAFLNKVNALSSRVDLIEARIKAADPRAILKRGYLLAADARGRVLKSAAAASPGDRISLLFSDGTLDCEVKSRR